MAPSDLKEKVSASCATELIFKYFLLSQGAKTCLTFLLLSGSIFIVIKEHWISSRIFFFLLERLLGSSFFGFTCLSVLKIVSLFLTSVLVI